MISLILPLSYKDFNFYDSDIGNSVISSQLEAIARRKTIVISNDICPRSNCWFNPRGNINQSRTISIERKGIQHELVIWLGFGRFKISKGFSYN